MPLRRFSPGRSRPSRWFQRDQNTIVGECPWLPWHEPPAAMEGLTISGWSGRKQAQAAASRGCAGTGKTRS